MKVIVEDVFLFINGCLQITNFSDKIASSVLYRNLAIDGEAGIAFLE